jgi:hypothetical protein
VNSPASIGIALAIDALVSGSCSDASCCSLVPHTSVDGVLDAPGLPQTVEAAEQDGDDVVALTWLGLHRPDVAVRHWYTFRAWGHDDRSSHLFRSLLV